MMKVSPELANCIYNRSVVVFDHKKNFSPSISPFHVPVVPDCKQFFRVFSVPLDIADLIFSYCILFWPVVRPIYRLAITPNHRWINHGDSHLSRQEVCPRSRPRSLLRISIHNATAYFSHQIFIADKGECLLCVAFSAGPMTRKCHSCKMVKIYSGGKPNLKCRWMAAYCCKLDNADTWKT